MSNAVSDESAPHASLIRVENKIKDKVTMGGQITGNGFDVELVKKAEKRVESLKDVFLDAVDKDMDRLVAAYQQALDEPEKRSEHLDTVQRVAHDIKGYGTNVGYSLLTRFGDSLSLFLRKAEAPDDARVEVTRVHVEAMRLVLNEQITGDGGARGEALGAGLDKAVRKYLSDADF